MKSIVDENGFLVHFCEGCEVPHAVPAAPPHPSPWAFNGNTERPTLSPSVMLRRNVRDTPIVCHYFIRDGSVLYCDDCTHELRGQTRPLIEIPANWQ